MRKWCATCYRCYQEDCLKIFRDKNSTKEEKDANYKRCLDIAKTEGYIPKPKKTENKLARATVTSEELDIPEGTETPMLPISLEAYTKKNQLCTTETQQTKHEPDQVEKLKRKLKASNEKAENLAIQNENMTRKNKQLETQNKKITEQINQLEHSMDKQESELKQQLDLWYKELDQYKEEIA